MTNLSDTLAALDLSPENIAEQVQALRNHADERQRKGWLTSAHNLRVGADYMEALSNELAAYRTGQLVPVPSVERVARVIASAMGDNYSDAFKNKDRWIAKRGMSGGRFRDVNEPMQCDYDAAATAAIAAMQDGRDG